MGGRKPVVSDEEILSVLDETEDPVLSSGEVSDHVSIGEQGTYQRLTELENRGLVASKKIGRGLAWWLTNAGEEFLASELNASNLNCKDGK